MYNNPNNDHNAMVAFQNPYKQNQTIQVRETNLSTWTNGIIINIGYDWIQVRYIGFSKKYDNRIYVDPNHIHFKKHETRLVSENIIKNEYKINDNNENDYKTDIRLNDKLLLKQLQQLVIDKRNELDNKEYNNVINDINTFLDGFDITNIPENKYDIVSALYVIYASSLGQKSEFDAAIKYCKKAINISPKFYKGYVTLALLYEFQLQYDDAHKQYKIALTLDMSQPKKRQIQQRYNKLDERIRTKRSQKLEQ